MLVNAKSIDPEWHLKSIGSIRAIEDFTFAKYEITETTRKYFEIADGFDPEMNNIFFYGRAGSGKSHLAYAIANKFLGQGLWGKCFKPMEIFRMFRMIEPHDEKYEIEHFSKLKFLLIDDLGIGRNTEFTIKVLYEVIEARLDKRQNGLIVTSNLSLDELAEQMKDDRLTSRLGGMCHVVKLDEKDWRLKS